MRHFRTMDQLREASLEELSGLEQMNEASARAVYEFFHGSK